MRPVIAVLICAAFFGGCTCPKLEPRFETPRDTLATWQTAFCHDDGETEYETLSREYRDDLGGYQIYNAARTYLQTNEPLFAWLLKHSDLEAAIVDEKFSDDGRFARLTLERAGQQITVQFERETLVTVVLDDGTERRRMAPVPLQAMLLTDGRLWQIAPQDSPRLSEEDLVRVRTMAWTSPWRIAFIDGLSPDAAP